jgi:DNA-binding CsgD family transcriptional regulator
VDGARTAADELRGIVADARTPWLQAASAFADGLVALADDDVAAAVANLRRACVTWHDLKLPYEAARARARYGEALRAAGDEDGARLEFRAAHATFERLGATPDATASDRSLGGAAYPSGLSAREVEVLRLVAAGKTNRDIAVELVISEHTVGRHLQNIYAKLGVSTRAAATAFAFEHGLT